MSTFAESLKRLYKDGTLLKFQIDNMLNQDKITKEEYEYIISD